jgi:UDP-glucose 4-epimerase
LDYLREGGSSDRINLGTGSGSSVLDVIKTARRITGCPLPVRVEERRAGDPSQLAAEARKALRVLNWSPAHSSLDEIIGSAWAWRQAHPGGYPE